MRKKHPLEHMALGPSPARTITVRRRKASMGLTCVVCRANLGGSVPMLEVQAGDDAPAYVCYWCASWLQPAAIRLQSVAEIQLHDEGWP